MPVLLPAEQFAALKTAWTQQVRQLGGNAATCSVTGCDPAQVSRYGALHHDMHVPVHVVAAAERCAVDQGGHPYVVAALARAIGHEIVPCELGRGDLAAAAEQVAASSGRLLGDTLRALADGVVDEAEALQLRGGLDELIRVARVMRDRLPAERAPAAVARVAAAA